MLSGGEGGGKGPYRARSPTFSSASAWPGDGGKISNIDADRLCIEPVDFTGVPGALPPIDPPTVQRGFGGGCPWRAASAYGGVRKRATVCGGRGRCGGISGFAQSAGGSVSVEACGHDVRCEPQHEHTPAGTTRQPHAEVSARTTTRASERIRVDSCFR